MARIDLRRAERRMQAKNMPLAMVVLVVQDMGGRDGRGGVAGVSGMNHRLKVMEWINRKDFDFFHCAIKILLMHFFSRLLSKKHLILTVASLLLTFLIFSEVTQVSPLFEDVATQQSGAQGHSLQAAINAAEISDVSEIEIISPSHPAIGRPFSEPLYSESPFLLDSQIPPPLARPPRIV